MEDFNVMFGKVRQGEKYVGRFKSGTRNKKFGYHGRDKNILYLEQPMQEAVWNKMDLEAPNT